MTLNDEVMNSLSTIWAQMNVSQSEFLLFSIKDENEYKKLIKERLIGKLLDELMKSNHIEFTAQDDVNEMSKTYRARLVSIPNHLVGKLRKEGKIP
jgi:hypothetical protein